MAPKTDKKPKMPTTNGKTPDENLSVVEVGDTKEIKYTSNACLDAIQFKDETVEIVAYVESMDGPKEVGKIRKYKLLKCILSNDAGKRIQCLAWEDQIARVTDKIQIHKIVHFNGLVAKKIELQAFNLGNVPYELVIKPHTDVEVIGTFGQAKNVVGKPTEVSWEDIADAEGSFIKISGWVKFPVKTTEHKNGESSYGLGSITNQKVKLSIRVTDCKDLPVDLKKGSAVDVIGVLQWDEDSPFIRVAMGSHVQLINKPAIDTMSMMDATAPPQKKARRE